MPHISEVIPRFGYQGDNFTVTILGDGLTKADSCSFGAGIASTIRQVVNDGELLAKLEISPNATDGDRDVSVTNTGGSTGTLPNGFEVRM